MEESSERLVRLGQHEIPFTGDREITTVDDVAIQSTSQDLPLVVGGLCARWSHADFFYRFRKFNQIRECSTTTTTTEQDIFSCFAPLRCSSDFVFLPHEEEEEQREECQRRPALPKTRPRQDPPPRVSRRSSQVSPPIYLRHRFQPRSRKDSSSRRQR